METGGVKERRRALILDCAMESFSREGIETAVMSEIAASAQVGEATLYRYFSSKEDLVLECGIRFWRRANFRYEELAGSEEFAGLKGIDQVRVLLELTGKLFREDRGSFHFLHDLDAYLVSHKVNREKMEEYERLIAQPMPILCNAIDKGKADGTVGQQADTKELYFTLTHTILSLLQKFAGMGRILSSDYAVAEERRIALLRELLLAGLAGGTVTDK